MVRTYEYKCDAAYDEVYRELYDPGSKVTRAEVNGIIKMLQLKPGDKVLDIPCGYGRHCKFFAQKGYKITGVDLSNKLMEIAKAKYNHPNITYIKGDMTGINLREKFDVCLNLYISFGFYRNNNDNLRVLKNVSRHLKPGGKFLLELVNPFNAVSKERISGSRFEESENYYAIIKKTIEPATMWENYNLRIIEKASGREIKNMNVGYYLYTIPEITRMAGQAGFKLKKYYGGGYHDFSGKPYQFDSARIIAVFERD